MNNNQTSNIATSTKLFCSLTRIYNDGAVTLFEFPALAERCHQAGEGENGSTNTIFIAFEKFGQGKEVEEGSLNILRIKLGINFDTFLFKGQN